MANLLEQFVLELRLDSTQFTDSQRQAADALRQVEGQATRSAGSIEKSGQGVVTFFRGVEAPLAALRRQFEGLAVSTARPRRNLTDLASQGARTGESIERGALAGASGLRVLGIAGLGAFAAITAVEKTMSALSATAARTFGVSVGAATAGLPIERFSAISQALKAAANVPEAETQAAFADIGSLQAGLRVAPGIYSPMVAERQTQLVQAGVQDANLFQDSQEETVNKIRARLRSVSAAEAIAIGRSIGLTETLSLALHNLSEEQYLSAVRAANQTALTKPQTEAASKLGEAEGKLGQMWTQVSNLIMERLEPAATWFLGWLTDILSLLLPLSTEKRTEAEKRVVPPVVDSPQGAFNAGPLGVLKSIWRAMTGSGSSTSRGSGATGPASLSGQLSSDDLAIMQRESRGNPNIGWSGLRGSADYSPGGTDLSNVPLDENGFPRWSGKMGPAGNSTAAGLFMITKSNWDKWAPRLGIHDFSPESQLKVRRAMQQAAGNSNRDWAASGEVLPISPSNGRTTYTIPKTDADVFSGGTFMKTSALIGAAQQGSVTSTSSTTNHNYGDSSIGDVTIHTQATDGPGVVAAFNDEITRRNSQASQANTGLT